MKIITSLENEKFYFNNNIIGSSNHLWITDGTKEGTHNITKNIDVLEVNISSKMFYKNQTLMEARVDNISQELWITDGTSEGTFSLTHHLDGFEYKGYSKELLNGKVVFTGERDYKYEIWSTDGTIEGTQLISQIDKGKSRFLQILSNENKDNNKLFFSLYLENNKNFWVTDGTSQGTYELINVNTTTNPTFNYRSDGKTLFFTNDINQFGEELWVTDGTFAGTQFVKDLREGPESSSLSFPSKIINGKAIVKAKTDDTNYSLFLTGDPVSGTVRICGSDPEFNGYNDIRYFPNNTAFLLEKNNKTINRTWFTDFTFAGTKLVMPLDATNNNQANGLVFNFIYNEYIYFFADYYGKGQQLYRIPNTISSVDDTPQPELMTVYPNPAKEFVQLELTKPMQLNIISSTGAKVKDFGVVANGKLNVAELHPGVYFVVDEQGNNIAKFVKE